MASLTLRERASKYVSKMPGAVSGAGGHDACFKVACMLMQGFDLGRSDARGVLDEYNARCDPPWSDRELEHKLNQADKMSGLQTEDGMMPRGCMIGDSQGSDTRPESTLPSRAPSAGLPKPPEVKPMFSPEILKRFAARWRHCVDTAWLCDHSPIAPFDAAGPLCSHDFLAHLFREGEKVVLFTNMYSQGQAMWPLQQPPKGGDEGVYFLSQPVDGRDHVNPREPLDENGNSKQSRRSEESVTSWRNLVIESDNADSRDWLAALVQLPLPISAIYTSGKRSIHALVKMDAPSKHEWDNQVRQLMPVLVTLGADKKAMSAVRLTRLPNCMRGDRLQKLLYLNPTPSEVAICDTPRLRDCVKHWTTGATTVMSATAREMREWEQWDTVEQCITALRWFEQNAAARSALSSLLEWSEAAQ